MMFVPALVRNLVEAHVLDAIQRHHQVPLSKIREAIHYLRKHFSCEWRSGAVVGSC
jgi:hypothetical protein